MIKIEIPDIEKRKSEYLARVAPKVKERVEFLVISLNHLNGDTIDVNIKGIFSWKAITINFLNDLGLKKKLDKKVFAKEVYSAKVSACLSDPEIISKLPTTSIQLALIFLKDLLLFNEKELKELLICSPEDLSTKNKTLLNKYNLNNETGKTILSYAFDYEKFSDISDQIKYFFRTNNFVAYCPYCNINKSKHNLTPEGKPAEGHQLDHFFDKAKHPLLSYSFFNLIPSCGNCNGSFNKGSILFTEEFHLNPYLNGFDNNLTFKPILKGREVIDLKLHINAKKGSKIRKQMFGFKEDVYEDDLDGLKDNEKGNANVFKLQTRYREEKEKAKSLMDRICTMNNGRNAIKPLLEIMNNPDEAKIHKRWYKIATEIPFDTNHTTDYAYSKFTKDIHDYYYQLDVKWREGYIKELLTND